VKKASCIRGRETSSSNVALQKWVAKKLLKNKNKGKGKSKKCKRHGQMIPLKCIHGNNDDQGSPLQLEYRSNFHHDICKRRKQRMI